jgi:hypothetical protein
VPKSPAIERAARVPSAGKLFDCRGFFLAPLNLIAGRTQCCGCLIEPTEREGIMKRHMAALVASGTVIAASGAALAHHSFAMFDQQHPIELVGTVTDFKYISPHCYIYLEVKGNDGNATVWNLEGGAPSLLIRDGWSSQSIKPGDELRMMIDPLRSGAPGGAFNVTKIKFKDGRPIVAPK